MPYPSFHSSRLAVLVALPLLCCGFVWAEDANTEALELFEKHVRPTLVDQCLRCHGEKKQQAGLRLDSREGWMAGGDSGPAIVPGKADESLLVEAVRYQNSGLEMPPKGVLPQATIQAIEKWIELGAPDPRSSDAATISNTDTPDAIEQGKAFWCFQPLRSPTIPTVRDQAWPRTEIDRFILARLEKDQLSPVADADRTTLLRRVYFDLIGLPPTPAQIEEFCDDSSPNAYADLIDRLLDSPQFGERWGRHWLDVVRFAQSSGGGRTLLFPDAWRYRDYVIDCFNDDLPYDEFVRQQIAGDLLEADDWQTRQKQLTATAFLLLGPTNYEMQDKDVLEMDVVDEQLDTIGKSMLAMTIGCARCHDHKFDPIPTHDYYAMAGILRSTKSMIHSNVSQWNTMELPISPDQEADFAAYQQRLASAKAELDEATANWIKAGGNPPQPKNAPRQKSIDPQTLVGIVVDESDAERIGQWTQSISTAGFVGKQYIHDAAADKGLKSVIYRPALPAAGQYEVRIAYPESSNRSSRVPVHIFHSGGETVVTVNQKQTPPIDGVLRSLGVFAFDPEHKPRVMVSNRDTGDGVVIADAVVFVRTDSATTTFPDTGPAEARDDALQQRWKEKVDALAATVKAIEKEAPKRPTVMATTDDPDAGDIHLAIRGVVHNPGPLTPRGALRIASGEPFPPIRAGESGRRELAQWITAADNPLTARVMVNRIWHWLIGRGIVSSVDNFGSMGQRPTHPQLLDHLACSFVADGWSVKALIRKVMLSRVYQLSSAPIGDAVQADPENRLLWRMNRKRLSAEEIRDAVLLISDELDTTFGGPNLQSGTSSEYGYRFVSKRRSVYVPVFRNTLPEMFEVFDFADPNIPTGKRNTSTIASQALWLMNHPFILEQSSAAANALLQSDQTDLVQRIQHAYRQVLGRAPGQDELAATISFLSADDADANDHRRWALLYQTLFQSIDFRYLN